MTRLFIVNPLSKRVATKGSILESLAADSSAPTKLFRLDIFEGLPNAVTQAAADDVDHVLIEGGDGTVQGVISEFLKQSDRFVNLPSFSIIPGGMTNQVAKNIGLKSSKLERVRKTLSSPLTELRTPLLEVLDSEGASYAGFVFSTGAIPQLTRYTTREIHRKGIGGSMAVLGGILKAVRGDDSALMNATPVSINDIHTGPHLGTLVTTLPGLILRLDPFWGEGNGPLRTTWVEGQYRRLARNIISIWMGRKHKDRTADGFHSGRFNALSFQYDGDVVLDGEFLSIPSGKFTVRPTRDVTFLH